MQIVMIGTGNVASVLGRKFVAAGHSILQVVGRNADAASALAYEWNTESTDYLSIINPNADVYLLAIADHAIAAVARELKLPSKVVAHTAASVPADVLKSVTDHYGVFYPLQSLRKEMTALPEIPVLVDGHDAIALNTLQQLAHSISPGKVAAATDDDRLKLHVAAVFVSNFTNHLYALADNYCKEEGIDFRQLLPLIHETANRISTIPPLQAQTGPAIRHDSDTILKHLSILQPYPHLHAVYEMLTRSIQQLK